MSFGQEYSTTTKRVFLCLFLLINVTMQKFANDIIYLSGPSGEFTSPGYPNTPPVFVGWNITVDQDHQILLQFLDFELLERIPCSLDSFELFDGSFLPNNTKGIWCWDTFNDLNSTIYLSSGNGFLIRLRTFPGYNRKGFKANYSRVLREATTTNSVFNIQTTTPRKLTNVPTTVTQAATSAEIASTVQSTSAEKTSPSSSVNSIETGMSTRITNTPTTDVADSPPFLKLEQYYLIAAAGGFLIICIFCLTVYCCLCYRKKNETHDSSKSNDTEFQVLAPAGPVQSSQTSHEGSNVSVKSLNSSKNDFTGKDNKKSPRPQSAYSSPTYAIPDKKKHEVFENDEDISRQSKVKESKGKLKVPLNATYATPQGVRPDSTDFEVNVAYQSCDSEKENGSNMTAPVNDEYTYVENTNVITEKPTAAPRVRAGEFKHSSSEKEEDGDEGSVPNIAYQSFDLEDEHIEEQNDEEMTTNVAYQSCDSEEENVGKSDATYYYVDEDGSDKSEEQKDIIYESV